METMNYDDDKSSLSRTFCRTERGGGCKAEIWGAATVSRAPMLEWPHGYSTVSSHDGQDDSVDGVLIQERSRQAPCSRRPAPTWWARRPVFRKTSTTCRSRPTS